MKNLIPVVGALVVLWISGSQVAAICVFFTLLLQDIREAVTRK